MPDRHSQQLPQQAKALVTVVLRLGEGLPGPQGLMAACHTHTGGLVPSIYLRDANGHTHPLRRRPAQRVEPHLLSSRTVRATPSGPARVDQLSASDTELRFDVAVPAGTYVLCAEVLGLPWRFPPRALDVTGSGTWSFLVGTDARPFFRFGLSLVHYEPAQSGLAAVLADRDVDPEASARLVAAMAAFGYQQLVDLDALDRRARSAVEGDAVVLEFRPARADHTPVDQLVRHASAVAGQAGIAPGLIRIGRLVSALHGRVVLDNELVLGFVRAIERDQAHALLAGAGARLLQDLSDPDGEGLIFVARFDGCDPETTLAQAETWMIEGQLHWVEPHLVEHC